MNKALNVLVEHIKLTNIKINFTIIEIGAVQIQNEKEPFYELLDYFPSSKIIGFELDKAVCEKMNSNSSKGVKYYPYALGKSNEKRKLYITQHPMCSSLYKPNEDLIKLYNNFEVAYLKEETEIDTISLDYFIDKHDVQNIDFIKIDVQGAELDIFKGGSNALKDVLKGETIVAPNLVQILAKFHQGDDTEINITNLISTLTPRENEILELLAEGQSNKLIAKNLHEFIKAHE